MKFTIGMKTPDAVDHAVDQAIEQRYPKYDDKDELIVLSEEDQWEREDLKEELKSVCSKWFKYGEAVTLEIDIETGVASVATAKGY